MKNYKFIPYDKNLVSRARELRKNLTEAEKNFWLEISRHDKLKKFKFTRQKPLGHFIVDFYCSKLGLVVEIDGDLHEFQKMRDEERDNFLKQKFGLKVVRYKNKEILTDTERVIGDLIRRIKSKNPLPTSPLSGRGEVVM